MNGKCPSKENVSLRVDKRSGWWQMRDKNEWAKELDNSMIPWINEEEKENKYLFKRKLVKTVSNTEIQSMEVFVGWMILKPLLKNNDKIH